MTYDCTTRTLTVLAAFGLERDPQPVHAEIADQVHSSSSAVLLNPLPREVLWPTLFRST